MIPKTALPTGMLPAVEQQPITPWALMGMVISRRNQI